MITPIRVGRRMLAAALLASGLAAVPDAGATVIPVDFTQAFRPPSVPTTLPALLAAGSASVTLQFNVPDFASILSINSIEVSVDVTDDGLDPAGESGVVRLGTDGPNPDIASFASLPGSLTVTGFVDAGDLAAAFDEISDNGFFRIRVRRESGDFFVEAGRVTIDANLVPVTPPGGTVPAPASLIYLTISAAAVGLVSMRRTGRTCA